MAAPKRSGLGRGLDALFADAVPVSDSAEKNKKSRLQQQMRYNT